MSTSAVTPQAASDPFASIAQPIGSESDPFASIAQPISGGSQSAPASPPPLTDGGSVPNARIRNLPNPAEGMTPGQALLNGVQTGAELSAIPSAPGMLDAAAGGIRGISGIGETLLQNAEEKSAEWASKYPHLIKIAAKIGIPTTSAALFGWLMHGNK